MGVKNERQFDQVAPLYDLLMTGVPYSSWLTYLKQLLSSRKAEPKTVLDLACGTGNVTTLLAREGYLATGVDIAPRMIAEASQKSAYHGLKIDFHVQDAAELNLGAARFDLCVSLFDSLNYIIQPPRLASAIERVARHLNPGGLFIFDINSEFALKNRFFDQSNRSHTGERLQYDWRSSYNSRTRLCRIDMDFTYTEDDGARRDFSEVHLQFAYREDEIRQILTSSGFDDISVYHAYSMRPPSRTSDRLFFVARLAG